MPDNEMPPGFEDLPPEEKLFIFGNRGKPEMMAVYQATKTLELHTEFERQCKRCDERINSLEDSRKKFKWVLGTVGTIFLAVKGFILTKILGGW
jgi:hypothetical protein